MPSPEELWRFLPFGYLVTIALETPILLIGLSRIHSLKTRMLVGVWLTACSYPIVVIVLPILMSEYSHLVFLSVAETFAPTAECALFWLAFSRGKDSTRRTIAQDCIAIVLANLLSFLPIEILRHNDLITW
jgi:hypothetical protein